MRSPVWSVFSPAVQNDAYWGRWFLGRDENTMSEQSSAFRFDPTRVGRLLSVYQEPEPSDDGAEAEDEKAGLLRDCLSEALPLREEVADVLPVMLRRMVKQLPRLRGQTLHALLTDPRSRLDDLERAKSEAKKAIADAQTNAEYEVAGVLYYAAIACALLYHGRKMTRHSHEQLADAFRVLKSKEWISGELRELFTRAGARCAGNTTP